MGDIPILREKPHDSRTSPVISGLEVVAVFILIAGVVNVTPPSQCFFLPEFTKFQSLHWKSRIESACSTDLSSEGEPPPGELNFSR